jgi:hypothetical protein
MNRNTNYPGNCPEYIAWKLVCDRRREYSSLCVSITLQKSLEICVCCAELAAGIARGTGCNIKRLWDRGFIVDTGGEVVRSGGWFPLSSSQNN